MFKFIESTCTESFLTEQDNIKLQFNICTSDNYVCDLCNAVNHNFDICQSQNKNISTYKP
jgi:hypothetical protein